MQIVDGDVLVLSSKIVSYFEDRVLDLSWVKASQTAKQLAQNMNSSEQLMEIVLCEADEVIAETPFVLLTRKNALYCANAGVDSSNVPLGYAVVWPAKPFNSCETVRKNLAMRKVTP